MACREAASAAGSPSRCPRFRRLARLGRRRRAADGASGPSGATCHSTYLLQPITASVQYAATTRPQAAAVVSMVRTRVETRVLRTPKENYRPDQLLGWS